MAKLTAGFMAPVLAAALGFGASSTTGAPATAGPAAGHHEAPYRPAQGTAAGWSAYPDPVDRHTPPSYVDATGLQGSSGRVSGNEVTATQVRKFLADRGSPMAPHASAIIEAGNRYDVDPRVVIAIAGVESEFGRHCRGYNAWGWDGGRTRWHSWEESIDNYFRLLATRYPNWRNIRRVAPRYNPNTPEAWGRKVAALITSITQAPS